MTNPYESPQTTPVEARPLWVRFTLWKVPTRRAAMLYVWFSILFAVACGVVGFWFSTAWAGLLVACAAPVYGVAIYWMDRHDGWGNEKPQPPR